jgi:hypothetical protein
MSAAVCRAIPLRRIGKLTFKTLAGCKRPLHLSRIIHIDVAYRRDKNRLQNKKRASSARFSIGFHRFLIHAEASARFFAPVSNG